MRRVFLLIVLCGLPTFAAASRRFHPAARRLLSCENPLQSVLTCMAAQGKTTLMIDALKRGTPVDQPDKLGATALHWAAIEGREETMRVLLDYHANVNQRNHAQGSPLHWAARSGNPFGVQFLLAHGANPNVTNDVGWTPLMIAADEGHSAAALALINHQTDLQIKGSQGETAWSLAIRHNHKDIARMIWTVDHSFPQTAPPPPSVVISGRPAPAPAAAPAQTVDKAEMERMIAAAVAKATAKPAEAGPKKSDADYPRYKVSENPDNYAVVIGIEKYSDIPDAEFAEHDAAAVRAHLAALGYPQRNIVSLIGSKATKTGMTKELETWLPQNVNEKSTVFIYYSGHGAPDVKTGKSFLVPWDGDAQFLEDTGYPVERLYQKLGQLKAKRVIVALDACFSGAGGRSVLAKGMRPLVTQSAVEPIPGKVVSLTAAGANQAAGAETAQAHGLFTYYLLRGLNGDAADKDGRVTVASLYQSLSKRVEDDARKNGADQAPQLLPVSAAAGDSVRLR
jgi:hypothetical protein